MKSYSLNFSSWNVPPLRVMVHNDGVPFGLTFLLGQRFTVKVLQAEAKGQFLLDLNSQRFWARTDLALVPGQEISLKVTQTSPTIELQVVEEMASTPVRNYALATLLQARNEAISKKPGVDSGLLLQTLERFLALNNHVLGREEMVQLQELLQPLTVTSEIIPLSRSLRNLLENAGFFYEAKLKTLLENYLSSPDETLRKLSLDLKSLLGHCERILRNSDGLVSKGLLLSKESLVEQLLSRQIEVAYHWFKDGTFCAELPLQFVPHQTIAKIRFFLNSSRGKPKASRTPFTLDILLDLPLIGRMEAWVRFFESQIQIMLFVEHENTRDLFQSQLSELKESLAAAGFEGICLEVQIDPTRLYQPEQAWDGAVSSGDKILSIKV